MVEYFKRSWILVAFLFSFMGAKTTLATQSGGDIEAPLLSSTEPMARQLGPIGEAIQTHKKKVKAYAAISALTSFAVIGALGIKLAMKENNQLGSPFLGSEDPTECMNFATAVAVTVVLGLCGMDHCIISCSTCSVLLGLLKFLTVDGFGIWWLFDSIFVGVAPQNYNNFYNALVCVPKS